MALEQLIGYGVLILLGLFIIGGLIFYGTRDEDDDPLQKRLAEYGDRTLPQSLEEIELSLPFQDRVLKPIFNQLADLINRLTPERQIDETRRQLELAGHPNNLTATAFLGLRIGATVIFTVLAFVIFVVLAPQPNGILYVIGAVALGYFLPSLWLKSQISRRQEHITKKLPDALDLLTICVEAGLGFDAAMGKIYEKWDDPLSTAFGRVLQEIQLGKLRREALRDMAKSMDVSDVTSFVAAIVQAEQLGVSMSRILRVQSDQMRIKRRQRAQEKAQQAPVKMMIPMVLLIFPSIWIVLLGPSLIILLETNVTF
ncbi:MAG: type II secretion system F family protein [Anaerolineae bacterium]|nr:type II secretion system F family protein [Anaerolineae bacterium]